MRARLPALLLGLATLGSAPAGAILCTPDAVPAATLLLPYFDLDARDLAGKKPKRPTPVISLVNVDPAAVLARVTLWTDLSVPTLAFDVYLTGYDVEDVDLFAVFRGALPGDRAVPCNDGETPSRELTAEQLEALRLAHAGKPVPADGGQCSAVDHGDTLLRGYVTVDNVQGCGAGDTAVFPSDPGYFGPDGIAVNANVLAGQVFVRSRKRKVFEPGRLVAIEAGNFSAGDATFYGRYVGGSGLDGREPLPAQWAVRTLHDEAAKSATDLHVWRNPEAAQGPFACVSLGQAGWYPLGEDGTLGFDDNENPFEVTGSTFPAVASRVAVGGDALPVPFASGWLLLDLGAGGTPRQSWVTARIREGVPTARGFVDATPVGGPTCGNAPPPSAPIP